jgi:hypothetical protein
VADEVGRNIQNLRSIAREQLAGLHGNWNMGKMEIDKDIDNRLDLEWGPAASWSLCWPVGPVRIDRDRFIVEEKQGIGKKAKPDSYDPTERAGEILSEISALDCDSDESLLGFVQRWGVLGLRYDEAMSSMMAERPMSSMIRTRFPGLADSVSETREALQRLKGFYHRLRAVEAKQWSDPALPKLSKRIRPRDRERAHRLSLAGGIAHALRWHPLWAGFKPRDDGTIESVLWPRSLHGVLYVELWRAVTSGEKEVRQCKGCERLFNVSRTNRKKEYHSQECKNRKNFKRWYARPQNRRKFQERRLVARKVVALIETAPKVAGLNRT